jgi:hypothetical protein
MGDVVKKLTVFLCFACLLFFLVPVSLFPVSVDWVSGDVAFSHLKGEWKKLDVGAQLASGDIVKTGPYSETTLSDDGAEIHILENSTFTVSERYEDGRQKSSMMLFLGRMRFKLARAREKEPEIRTQTVNLSIRGTDFEIGSGYDGSTLVLLSSGVLAVRGKSQEIVLEGGEGTQVAFGEEPAEKFELITRVIEWETWLADTREAVKGNELELLSRILGRMREMDDQIGEYETLREQARELQQQFVQMRNSARDRNDVEAAAEFSRKAGEEGKAAYHLLMNIRFLALSSIGLQDLAAQTIGSVPEPDQQMRDTFEEINSIYGGIESKYIYEGDRETLEERASRKKGCLKLF